MILTPKRRRFQWSLRTLFVVVTLAGVFSGWLVYHLNWIRERRSAKVGFGILTAQPIGSKAMPIPCYAPWPLGWLGEEGRSLLFIPDFHSKQEIDRIKVIFPEAEDFEIVTMPADFVWPTEGNLPTE